LAEVAARLAATVSERDRLLENYGKDAMVFTQQITALKEEIKLITSVARSADSILTQKNGEIASLKERLEKTDADTRGLKESNEQSVKKVQEAQATELKRVSEEHRKEIENLKEAHCKDLIKFYISAKTRSMGLRLPEHVLTLLESCKTVDEVDVMVRKAQNMIRENLVQSTGIVSEIVVESQSDPNPVLSDIRSKVGIALKHFGV
jgi:DNA anti-recombination protein RmuC